MKRVIYFLIACVLLSACSVKKHTVTNTEQHTTEHSQRINAQTEFRLDSVLQSLDIEADSIIILVTPSAKDSLAPTMRVTAHRPKVQAQTKKSNLALVQSVEQDSASLQTQANSHADNSKEVVGVARPAHSDGFNGRSPFCANRLFRRGHARHRLIGCAAYRCRCPFALPTQAKDYLIRKNTLSLFPLTAFHGLLRYAVKGTRENLSRDKPNTAHPQGGCFVLQGARGAQRAQGDRRQFVDVRRLSAIG